MNLDRLALAALLMCAPALLAQNDRSWVSRTRNDTNSCLRSQPCATFQGALAKTNSPGEIDVVDPGDYGTITISGRTLTLDGGGMGRIMIPGVKNYGIQVLNGSVATIRNLSIRQIGTAQEFAIAVSGAGTIATIENVNIDLGGMAGSGWALEVYSGQATLSHSTIQGAYYCVISFTSATVAVDHSLLTACNTGIEAWGGVALIRQNVIVGNTTGLAAANGGSIVSFMNNGVHNNSTNGSPTATVPEE